MMVADVTPPAVYCPAPLPSRSVMVFGDRAAMEKMRVAFASQGWTWATMLLGGQTEALTLAPPDSVKDADVCALVDGINAGKFGKLNAGFATFGITTNSPRERGR